MEQGLETSHEQPPPPTIDASTFISTMLLGWVHFES
jgi:hypothetical protein